MQKFFVVIATAYAAFLDFAMGSFIASVAGLIAHLPVESLIPAAFIGGLLALIPDLDCLALYFYWGRGGAPSHHLWISHRPLIVIPLMTAAGFWLGGSFWAWTAGLCVFWHYLHDTQGLGDGGIAWLWPFSRKFIALWPPFQLTDPLLDETITRPDKEAHNRWLFETYLEDSGRGHGEFFFGYMLLSITASLIIVADIENFLPIFCVLAAVIILKILTGVAYHLHKKSRA